MSHFKERKEKNCLNCNAEVLGKFCQVCGQENIQPKESFWHLVTHFFYDITHFDGKFFNTVKYLLLKPGFLTYEYERGKRMTYVHPIRLYVFTSAFFFLLYFSFISKHNEEGKEGIEGLKDELVQNQDGHKKLVEMKENTNDSTLKTAIEKAILHYNARIAVLNDSIRNKEKKDGEIAGKTGEIFTQDDLDEIKTTVDSITQNAKEEHLTPNVNIDSLLIHNDSTFIQNKEKISEAFLDFEFYKDELTYVAVQKELPKDKQDGLLKRSIQQELLRWHDKHKKEGTKISENIKEKFKHSFPTLLFISLPIFAFLLKLLYIRRKKFYYADHGIFAIHVYCAAFILLLFYYLFDALKIKTGWWIFSLSKAILVIYMTYYTYKAMRNFYEQGRFKTLFKYIFLSWMTSILMFILVLIFLVISAYKA